MSDKAKYILNVDL